MIVIDYLSMLSKHELGQRMHGLSGVEIVLGGLWVVLKLEWNLCIRGHPPSKSAGLLLFLSLLSIFFFGSDFATASCSCSSSSTPANASSLVSALYLIRTNDIAVLIRSLSCQL